MYLFVRQLLVAVTLEVEQQARVADVSMRPVENQDTSDDAVF